MLDTKRITVIDVETSNIGKGNPFISKNFLVSFCALDVVGGDPKSYFHHFFDPRYSNVPCDMFIPGLNEFFEILFAEDRLIVGHNLKFDLHWLHKYGWVAKGKLWDTLNGAFALRKDPKQSLTLQQLTGSKNVLGELLVHKHEVSPLDIPASWLIAYGLKDVKATYKLFLQQQKTMLGSI